MTIPFLINNGLIININKYFYWKDCDVLNATCKPSSDEGVDFILEQVDRPITVTYYLRSWHSSHKVLKSITDFTEILIFV